MRSLGVVGWGVCLGLTMVACGDEGGGDPVVSVPCEPAADERGNPYACIAGSLESATGEPVVGVRVSACTHETCITGQTAADGTYLVQRLPVEPHKVEILGAAKGFMTLAFFQDVVPGEVARATRTVILPRLTNAAVSWTTAQGGTASVAGGKLELQAGADVLRYPIGTPEEEMVVEAVAVPLNELVPYDIEPWKGKESSSMAFLINPFPLTAGESIGLKVKDVGAAANKLFTLYAANASTGELDEAGILVADADGNLVLQPGASLTQLTTLVIVPN